jgi:hypothetical protein
LDQPALLDPLGLVQVVQLDLLAQLGKRELLDHLVQLDKLVQLEEEVLRGQLAQLVRLAQLEHIVAILEEEVRLDKQVLEILVL